MDKIEVSASIAGEIENLGDSFQHNLLMGTIANSTSEDLEALAKAIETAMNKYHDLGLAEEEIVMRLQFDEGISEKLERLFARFVMTADQYAYIDDEGAESAMVYTAAVGQALKELQFILQERHFQYHFVQLLHKYGNGAKNHLDFQTYLEEVYKQRVEAHHAKDPNEPTPRIQTADYTDELSPVNYVESAILKRTDSPSPITLRGILMPTFQNSKEDNKPLLQEDNDVSTGRHDTEMGLGQNEVAFKSPEIEVPPQSALPQIEHENEEDDAVTEEPTLSMGIGELFDPTEIITANDLPKTDKTSPTPSTSAVPDASTGQARVRDSLPEIEIIWPMTKKERQEHEENLARKRPSSRPPLADIFTPPPPSQQTIETAVLSAINASIEEDKKTEQVPGEQEDVVPVSPEPPDAVSEPTPEIGSVRTIHKETSPRTVAPTVLEPLLASPPITPATENTPAIPAPTPDALPLPPNPTPVPEEPSDTPSPLPKMEPIATPSDLKLPSSSYRPGPSRSNGHLEDTVVTRQPDKTPGQVTGKTRSKIWKWAAATAAAAGLAGIFGAIYLSSNQEDDSSDAKTAATASSSSSPKTAAINLSSSSDRNNKSVDSPTPVDQGVYRLNTSNPAFADYLCSIRQATGLVSKVKNSAANAKVHYYSDNAARTQAQERHAHVLTGSESEQQQRITMMKAFLDDALQHSSDNLWLVRHFKDHKAGVEAYEQSGTWNNKALALGTDKLFAAMQTEKLTTAPNIIGYAPDVNPETNPAILKIKAGAPTFYKILREVGQQMQSSTNPEDLAPFDDPRSIKEITCARVLKAGQASRDKDTRSGMSYMHAHWCQNECAPENTLTRALRVTVPVKAEVPTTPFHKPRLSPGHSLPIHGPAAPVHTRLETTDHSQQYAVAEKKPSLWQRATSKVKSFFGLGKKAVPLETQTAQAVVPPVEQPAYTSRDLPMYSWKETLKQYFWG